MAQVRLILVGGFLGSGKTTLLWEAARRLTERGRRVGLITNDQAPDLVDTGLLAQRGLDVREVAGSCFCCNFPGLLDAAEALERQVQADVLIAEPVGSCTDLSATILQPLKEKFTDRFTLSPLSVLADPRRLAIALGIEDSALHPSAVYIIQKQLEEADLIAVNKLDRMGRERRAALDAAVRERFPGTEVRFISALHGQGVDPWLETVLRGGPAGRIVAEVDYDTYAEGEAVLGWLNAAIHLRARRDTVDWHGFSHELLTMLQAAFARRRAAVGHVKLLLSAAGEQLVGNLTEVDEPIALRGAVPEAAHEAQMVLNARAELAPEALEALVRQALPAAAGERIAVTIEHLQSLRPGRPRPTHRYPSPV